MPKYILHSAYYHSTKLVISMYGQKYRHCNAVSIAAVNSMHLTVTRKAVKLTLVKRQHWDLCCAAKHSLMQLWHWYVELDQVLTSCQVSPMLAVAIYNKTCEHHRDVCLISVTESRMRLNVWNFTFWHWFHARDTALTRWSTEYL